MLLKTKNAVIYAAGGSIGGAVARAFAREGAWVFLAGRTLTDLEKIVKDIAASRGKAAAAQVDALDEQAVESYVDTVVKQAGRIDVSFNAIKIDGSTQGTALVDLSPQAVSLPVMRRVAANFLTARAAARNMVEKGAGVILMITASPARMAWPLTGIFGMREQPSKASAALWRANSHRRVCESSASGRRDRLNRLRTILTTVSAWRVRR